MTRGEWRTHVLGRARELRALRALVPYGIYKVRRMFDDQIR